MAGVLNTNKVTQVALIVKDISGHYSYLEGGEGLPFFVELLESFG